MRRLDSGTPAGVFNNHLYTIRSATNAEALPDISYLSLECSKQDRYMQ